MTRTATAIVLAALALGLLLASSSLPAPAAADKPAEFTPEETERLAAGELVTRPIEMRRNALDLFGGSSWQVIDVPPGIVWRAVQDIAHYPNMVPRIVEAQIVGDAGERESVYIRQGAWPVFTSYYLTLQVDTKAQTVHFELDPDRPHGLTAGFGFARITPYAGKKTLMTFGVLADVGHGLLSTVARSLIHTWMLKVPWQVKRFLESGGKNLYAREALTTAALSQPPR